MYADMLTTDLKPIVPNETYFIVDRPDGQYEAPPLVIQVTCTSVQPGMRAYYLRKQGQSDEIQVRQRVFATNRMRIWKDRGEAQKVLVAKLTEGVTRRAKTMEEDRRRLAQWRGALKRAKKKQKS